MSQVENHQIAIERGYKPVLEGGWDNDETCVRIQYLNLNFRLYITDMAPATPIFGGYCRRTDNIATRSPNLWMVDSNIQCWVAENMNGILFPVLARQMLRCMEKWQDRQVVRKRLGLLLERPMWYDEAMELGWIPPKHIYVGN